MKNNDQRLNDLLDAPALLDNRFHGCFLFESARITQCTLEVIGWDGTLGLARSTRTSFQVAFTIKGVAKPLARRQYRAELNVELFNIETVSSEDGVILSALGEPRGRRRLVAWEPAERPRTGSGPYGPDPPQNSMTDRWGSHMMNQVELTAAAYCLDAPNLERYPVKDLLGCLVGLRRTCRPTLEAKEALLKALRLPSERSYIVTTESLSWYTGSLRTTGSYTMNAYIVTTESLSWYTGSLRTTGSYTMNAYIVTASDKSELTTDIVSVHLTPAAALKAMKRLTARSMRSYQQHQAHWEEFPWYENEDETLEIQVHPIS